MTTGPVRFDLGTIAAHHVAVLGKTLRERAASARSPEGAAAIAVELLHDALMGPDGERGTALVRVFCTAPLGALGPEAQDAARAIAGNSLSSEVRCLTLLATRGREPEWNDRSTSRGHRAIPLPTARAIEQLPMIAALLSQLGLDVAQVVRGDRQIMMDASERSFNSFHVPVAAGSPYIPAQEDFVLRYGIASAFGFGGVLPSGEVFAAIVFATVPVSAQSAQAFETLALHLRLALIDADPEAALLERAVRSRAAALEQLLVEQERSLVDWAKRLADDRDSERAAHAAVLAQRADELRAKNERLEQAHLALEQVVIELRQARDTLEQRVADRTEALRRTNLALSESNRELEQFAHIASHDLQEPLRTVIGHLQLLEERFGPQLDDSGREFIGFAVNGARRMQGLIESLLLYSRVTTQARPHAPVDLGKTVREVRESLAAALEESAARVDQGELPTVMGDAVQLRQLFQNLIANSVKFSGGRPPHVEIRSRSFGDRVEIEVEDHGIGFQQKFAEAIFKVFRRLSRDTPGTGIGLAIVRKIVERHGGAVRAEANPGQGARFILTLPVPQRTPERPGVEP